MRSLYDGMQVLVARGIDHMTVDELRMLSGATETAENEAHRLSKMLGEIGCLVGSDAAHTNPPAGNFQDADSVQELLFSVAHGLDTISALIYLGSEARYRAQKMEKKGAAA